MPVMHRALSEDDCRGTTILFPAVLAVLNYSIAFAFP